MKVKKILYFSWNNINLVFSKLLYHPFTGGWIQCASFKSDRYGVIMASQTLYAVGQVFVLSLPPFIAGVWFGAKEVGLACAFGVFGNQVSRFFW